MCFAKSIRNCVQGLLIFLILVIHFFFTFRYWFIMNSANQSIYLLEIRMYLFQECLKFISATAMFFSGRNEYSQSWTRPCAINSNVGVNLKHINLISLWLSDHVQHVTLMLRHASNVYYKYFQPNCCKCNMCRDFETIGYHNTCCDPAVSTNLQLTVPSVQQDSPFTGIIAYWPNLVWCIPIVGTLGCVFIDNETHESGVTKCTTGEAWSAFSWHHSSVFHCQWTHNQVFLLLSHMLI